MYKLIPVLHLGPRTQDATHVVVHALVHCWAPGVVPVCTSDGLDLYFYALTAHFGTGWNKPPPSGCAPATLSAAHPGDGRAGITGHRWTVLEWLRQPVLPGAYCATGQGKAAATPALIGLLRSPELHCTGLEVWRDVLAWRPDSTLGGREIGP